MAIKSNLQNQNVHHWKVVALLLLYVLYYVNYVIIPSNYEIHSFDKTKSNNNQEEKYETKMIFYH